MLGKHTKKVAKSKIAFHNFFTSCQTHYYRLGLFRLWYCLSIGNPTVNIWL